MFITHQHRMALRNILPSSIFINQIGSSPVTFLGRHYSIRYILLHKFVFMESHESIFLVSWNVYFSLNKSSTTNWHIIIGRATAFSMFFLVVYNYLYCCSLKLIVASWMNMFCFSRVCIIMSMCGYVIEIRSIFTSIIFISHYTEIFTRTHIQWCESFLIAQCPYNWHALV